MNFGRFGQFYWSFSRWPSPGSAKNRSGSLRTHLLVTSSLLCECTAFPTLARVVQISSIVILWDELMAVWHKLVRMDKKLQMLLCHEKFLAFSPFKGALSRYSVIFCTILLWGKIMAAVHLSKAKRAQQVSCLSIIVAYIVLCSEIYATAPESLVSLERSSNQDNSRSIRGAPQACFGFHEFTPFFMGKLVFFFFFTFLILSQSPSSSERGMTLQG